MQNGIPPTSSICTRSAVGSLGAPSCRNSSGLVWTDCLVFICFSMSVFAIINWKRGKYSSNNALYYDQLIFLCSDFEDKCEEVRTFPEMDQHLPLTSHDRCVNVMNGWTLNQRKGWSQSFPQPFPIHLLKHLHENLALHTSVITTPLLLIAMYRFVSMLNRRYKLVPYVSIRKRTENKSMISVMYLNFTIKIC